MESTTTLTMVDGVRVVVPDSLELITTFVLREQEDWFEDEIKFLRRLIRPGEKIIDIGANHGVYTLSMARTVGPGGRIWAFEPATSTAALLSQSIAANGFDHVVLDQRALSNRSGQAELSLNANSEINSLIPSALPGATTETVQLSTLDECLDHYAWPAIDFMKIDAEGEEANILDGGSRFFAEQSPLVMYEIKADTSLHMDLVDRFQSLGYDSYRLVPGLDILVPFQSGSKADGFLLNLFCCKPDRARQLAADGFLATVDADDAIESARALLQEAKITDAHNWRQTLTTLPYGKQLAAHWHRKMFGAGDSVEVDKALTLHACSRDLALTPAQRYGALEASRELLEDLCEEPSPYLRMASLARVARECGMRSLAVSTLNTLCQRIMDRNEINLGEPFLAPSARFDAVEPRNSVVDWVLAATLEELERLGSFSSYYARDAGRARLDLIYKLGFGSAEMKRRFELLQQRFDRPAA